MTDRSERRPQAAVYVRVSLVGGRDRESVRYQTETEQEERCRAYASAKGYDVLEVAVDSDVSGGHWERDGLDRVLGLAESGRIDALIVYRLSRLGRGLKRVVETAERLEAAGVVVISVNEGFDRSTPAGRMMFNLLASFDEYERALRGEYWAGSQRRASERGVLLARTPFGYRRSDDGLLEPDPETAPVVAELFARRAGGQTIESLCRWLDDAAPRPDGKRWQTSRVSQSLRLRVYLGEITRDGRTQHGTHPPLVDAATFGRVTTMVVRRASASKDHDFLLSGLARCATCGGAMSGQARAGANRDTPAYRCRRLGPDGSCDGPALMIASRLEPYVLGMWRERMATRRAEAEDGGGPAAQLAVAQREADLADQEVRAYLTNLSLKQSLGGDEWQLGLDARLAAREATRGALGRLRDAAAASDLGLTVADIEADPEILREALRGEIAKVVVRRGRGAPADRISVEFVDGTLA